MATSGSYNFTVNRNEAAKLVLREIGALGRGMAPTSEQIMDVALRMNMILKQWQGNADFTPGLKAWTRKRGVVFLENNKASYQLGTDQATADDYLETTCKFAGSATDTELNIFNISDVSDGDYAVIHLDDGTVHTTTVTRDDLPGSDAVDLADALPADVSIGNTCWFYTNKMMRPLEIIHAYLRDTDGNDIPLDPMSLGDYEAIADKDAEGTPGRYYFEKERMDATLYLDAAVEDITDVLHLTFLRPLEDMDAANDEIDMPQNWYRPLILQTAVDIAPSKGKEASQTTLKNLAEALAMAGNEDPETSDTYFEKET